MRHAVRLTSLLLTLLLLTACGTSTAPDPEGPGEEDPQPPPPGLAFDVVTAFGPATVADVGSARTLYKLYGTLRLDRAAPEAMTLDVVLFGPDGEAVATLTTVEVAAGDREVDFYALQEDAEVVAGDHAVVLFAADEEVARDEHTLASAEGMPAPAVTVIVDEETVTVSFPEVQPDYVEVRLVDLDDPAVAYEAHERGASSVTFDREPGTVDPSHEYRVEIVAREDYYDGTESVTTRFLVLETEPVLELLE